MSQPIPELPPPPTPREIALSGIPEPQVGQIVYWYLDGRRGLTAYAAIVIAVSAKYNAELKIFYPESDGLHRKDAVYHVDDPDARDEARVEDGGWEHTPDTMRLYELEATVQDLWELFRSSEPETSREPDGDGEAATIPTEGEALDELPASLAGEPPDDTE